MCWATSHLAENGFSNIDLAWNIDRGSTSQCDFRVKAVIRRDKDGRWDRYLKLSDDWICILS